MKKTDKPTIILEEHLRFSETSLWPAQKRFYTEKGVDAWTTDVPCFISSNCFIANAYANTVIQFILDWTTKNPNSANNTFHILELGAGTGLFSFHFLTALTSLQKQHQLAHIKIGYIMTDIVPSLFEFWQAHDALKPFIDSGLLDFATLDLQQISQQNKDLNIQLTLSEKTLTHKDIKNPLTLIGNYIFDSIATDLFHIKDGEIKETRATLKTTPDNISNHTYINLEKLDISYDSYPINGAYYKNDFDKILNDYKETLKDTYLQFPIQLLTIIEKFKSFANDKLLLITSDKAYTELDKLDDTGHPQLTPHGNCFSVMVNFHALTKYIEHCGGEHATQKNQDLFNTNVFSTGFSINTLPRLHAATLQLTQKFTPVDFYYLYENISEKLENYSLEALNAFFTLSNWDPAAFCLAANRIQKLAPEADQTTVANLLDHLPNIIDNFYFYPGAYDIFFQIGLIYYEKKYNHEAIKAYEKSQKIFGETANHSYNIGLCHYNLDNKKEAKAFFKQSHKLDPDSENNNYMVWLTKDF